MTAFPVTGGQRLRVEDVLLAGETSDGPALVSIEALVVDESGLTIVGPRPGAERQVPWSEISGFGGLRPATLPTGATASALVIEVRGRALRFLLPDAGVSPSVVADLDREIAARLAPAADAPPATPVPNAPEEPESGEGPVRHASPTPHMPPTTALHPIADVHAPVAGAAAPARIVPFDSRTGSLGAPSPQPPGVALGRPVPPAAVPVPPARGPEPTAMPHTVEDLDAAADADAPSDADADAGFWEDEVAVAPAATKSKRDRRKRGPRGVRQSETVVARPLLAADDFEFASDPSLPKGGPPPGSVIEVSRHHRTAKRAAVLFVILVLVATGAGVWYYTKHQSLPFGVLSHRPPPPHPARDLAMAAGTVLTPSDLPGWTVQATSSTDPFAMGASSSAKATRASAGASTALALCLRVPASTLSAATGVAGAAVPDRTAFASSRVFTKPGDGSVASSATDVMDSSSVVQADTRVFANPTLFATCYEPYVQSMLPYVSAVTGGSQVFDTATVETLGVPAPTVRGVHAYGFQITLLGHSGNNGISMVLDDVAVFGGRAQATMSMSSSLVFPVDTQAALIQATEARVAGVLGH
jgi:hypothetical protein